MKSIETYQKQFLAYLEDYKSIREPKNLYEPIEYILNLGGKRLRPVLTLMTTDCFEGDTNSALDAALAVEVFHNFSLIHDDIMDAAPLRRGHQTVHEKWDLNTGILSGDAMVKPAELRARVADAPQGVAPLGDAVNQMSAGVKSEPQSKKVGGEEAEEEARPI